MKFRSSLRSFTRWHWTKRQRLAVVVSAVTVMGLALLSGVSASAAPDAATPPVLLKAAQSASSPQPQMSDLNFMLGSFRCVEVEAPGQSFPTTHSTVHAFPILGGTFYEMNLIGQNAPTGQWYFGYDQSHKIFDTEYIDSGGSYGSSTSPGFQDGHIAFTGTYIFPSYGVTLTIKDDIIPNDKTFVDDESSFVNGQWILKTITTCQRIAPEDN